MSSSPGPSAVKSVNVPAASSSWTASARALMFSVLSSARCIARPPSAISCHPRAPAARGLGDSDLSLRGGVLGLDDLLLGAELLDLRPQLLLGGRHLLLLLLELGDLGIEGLELGLRDVLAFERDSRQVLVAGGQRLACLRVELDDLLLHLLGLEL